MNKEALRATIDSHKKVLKLIEDGEPFQQAWLESCNAISSYGCANDCPIREHEQIYCVPYEVMKKPVGEIYLMVVEVITILENALENYGD